MPDIGHWIECKQKHGKPEWSWSAVNIRDRDRPDLGILGSSTQLLGVAPLQRWGWIMRLWDRAGQVWSCSSYRSKIYGHNPHPKSALLLQMFLVNKCSFSGFLFRFLPLLVVSGDACQSSWRYLSVPPRHLSVVHVVRLRRANSWNILLRSGLVLRHYPCYFAGHKFQKLPKT